MQGNNGVCLNHTLKQWVNLGDVSAACMAKPTSSEPCSGTLTARIRIDDCGNTELLTSTSGSTTGFHVFCYSVLRF